MGTFSIFFPKDFAESILPKDITSESYFGYRVAKYGLDCPMSYASWFEDKIIEGQPKAQSRDAKQYSTSLFDKPDYPRFILSLVMRDGTKPRACLVKGYTVPECGPSKIGRVEPHKTRNGVIYCRHIDWWVYEESHPWEYFEEAGNEA